MDDLISRKDIIDFLLIAANCIGAYGYLSAKEIDDYISNFPSTQPERKTGEWIKDSLCTTSGGTYAVRRCSLCETYYHDVVFTWNYCPNCGADMRGEQE